MPKTDRVQNPLIAIGRAERLPGPRRTAPLQNLWSSSTRLTVLTSDLREKHSSVLAMAPERLVAIGIATSRRSVTIDLEECIVALGRSAPLSLGDWRSGVRPRSRRPGLPLSVSRVLADCAALG